MDPVTAVGLAASISQLISGCAKAVKYLNDVRDAPRAKCRLEQEAAHLLVLLMSLKSRVEGSNEEDPWFGDIRSLATVGGPLDRFKRDVEGLAGKLKGRSGLRRLVWTLDKCEVEKYIESIERVKSLVGLALQKDHFKLSLAIKSDLADAKENAKAIADGVTSLQKGQRDQRSQDIIDWISPLNFTARHQELAEKRQQGTGQWFIDSAPFHNWLKGSRKTMLCEGIAGAGKTILTSIVVDHLKRSFAHDNIGIIYIYCNYKEEIHQTARNLTASLLQQLSQSQPTLSPTIVSLYDTSKANRKVPDLSQIYSLLATEIQRFTKVFIVVDALDECPEITCRELFIRKIKALQKSHPGVHVLVTSRHGSILEPGFNEDTVRVEIRANNDDIEKYLRSRIEGARRLRRFVACDPGLQNGIIEAIIEKSQGMFLLARLHMDSLTAKVSRKSLREALNSLPLELDATYDEAMERIEHQPQEESDLAKRILCWVSFALRPLTVSELRHAVAVEPGDADIDDAALSLEEDIVSLCAGLVVIDRGSNTVGLLHYTAQEYFQRAGVKGIPDPQTYITTVCLTYLSFDVFEPGPCSGLLFLDDRMYRYPLLEYAAKKWGHHSPGGLSGATRDLAMKLLRHPLRLGFFIQMVELWANLRLFLLYLILLLRLYSQL